ncbi:MAG: AsmA family protein [Flavobacteriaceae bacterium]
MIAIALVFAALAAGVLLLPQLVSTSLLKREVARYATQLTGYDVQIRGDTSLRLFPTIGFNIRDVTLSAIGNSGPPVATMDELAGAIELLPLLKGHVSVRSFTLVRPQITVVRGPNGGNWNSLAEGSVENAERKEPQAQPGARSVRIGLVRVVEGTLRYDSGNGEPVAVPGIDAALSWPSASAPLQAEGSFAWSGTPVAFRAEVADPAGLFAGRQSTVVAALTSSVAKLRLDGKANMASEFQLTGRTEIASEAARALFKMLGANVPAGPGLNSFSLAGDVNLVGRSAAFSKLSIALDGNRAEGVMKIGVAQGVTSVNATLASDSLDLSRYTSGGDAPSSNAAGGTAADWRDRRIDLSGLKPYDLDIRMSAANVKIGNTVIGRAAASVTARGGRFQIAIGEASLFGGQAKGTLSGTISGSAGSAPAMANFQLKDLQAAPLLAALGGKAQFGGRIDATVSVDGNGASVATFQRSMSGQARIDIQNATVNGVDLKRLLELLLAPNAAPGQAPSGQTVFSRIGGNFAIRTGKATTSDLQFAGNNLNILVAGDLDIPSRAIRGTGTATLGKPADSGSGKVVAEMPFIFDGTLDSPHIAPDPKWLMQKLGGKSGQNGGNSLETVVRNGLGALAPRLFGNSTAQE